MASSLQARRRVEGAEALPLGHACHFVGVVRGEERRCFVVRVPSSGALVAFLNVCAHRNQPVAVDDRPFDAQGLLECRAHGARYAPETGVCVDGPCVGAGLVAVPLEEEGDAVFAIDDDSVDDSIYE